MKSPKLTWSMVQSNLFGHIALFEDPVYSSYIERDTFVAIYDKLLIELYGTDSLCYFSNYFEPSPVNSSIYIFINDEMRKDFYEFALELGIVLSMKEIQEGESKAEKAERITIKPHKQVKKQVCPKLSATKRSEQMLKTLDKLTAQLENEADPVVRAQIEGKMNRVLALRDKTV